jgi:hypothetical protein
MIVELTIYIMLSAILSAIRRVISGMKNGAFYGKTGHHNPKLDKYIKNIHFLETPAWYTQFGSLFFSVFAVFRAVNYSCEPLDIFMQFVAAMLVTMGSSGMASYHFQGWINYGEDSPFYNPKEDKMSEFAFGPISFWWNRGWLDKHKRLIPFIGYASIIVGIYLGLKWK